MVPPWGEDSQISQTNEQRTPPADAPLAYPLSSPTGPSSCQEPENVPPASSSEINENHFIVLKTGRKTPAPAAELPPQPIGAAPARSVAEPSGTGTRQPRAERVLPSPPPAAGRRSGPAPR